MHLAEADVVVLLLHDLLHRLLLFERDEAETSPLVGLVLHRQLYGLHLFRCYNHSNPSEAGGVP